MRTKRTWKWMMLACCAAWGARAVTPAELSARLAQGEKVTVVDVRSPDVFKSGHIPNAVNVPERALERKKLPPLGSVVVCGRGLGTEDVERAARVLSAKPGIAAEVLEGGYAAWQTERGQTTEAAGFAPERLDYIAYSDLEDLSGDDIVLVDLRVPNEPDPDRLTRQGTVAEAEPLCALSARFPGKSVVDSPLEIPEVKARTGANKQRMANAAPVPVMVLIDNGDGEAEKTARMLRANGIQRVVILAGGERILERGGAAGLQRKGMGSQTLEGDNE